MNGFGTIDNAAILMPELTRDQVLKYREALRAQLRAFEDMYQLPHSFKTKAEMDAELRARGLHGATVKEGHHNR